MKISNKSRKLRLLMVLMLLVFMVMPAQAGGLVDHILAQGTISLVKDTGIVVTILGPLVGGVAAGVCLIRRAMVDKQEGKEWMDRAKIAICCGVGVGLVSGIIALVASYYSAG